jgi:hypothetical protein
MELPNDFYTVTTLLTLSGSSMAVLIITAVLGDLLGRKYKLIAKKWTALFLSLFFSLLGVTLIKEKSLLIWVVAVVNGFLIYAASVGWNSMFGNKKKGSDSSIRDTSVETQRQSLFENFFERWW